jgi:hypothetical protein
MKFFIACLTSILLLFSSVGLADCKWSEGVKEQADGYLYTPECHKKVGKVVTDLEDREEQVNLLKEALTYQKEATEGERKRAELWRDTTFKLEDRMTTIERWKKYNDWMYFGFGVLVTGVSAWAIGQAAK